MELFDLYDMNRLPTGKTLIRGSLPKVGEYRIVVHICIFNSDGNMLIQQRQPFKNGWSGMWDITCGGSAIAGDTSQTAAQRELLEELGLDISFENIRPVLTINFDEGYDDIYVVKYNAQISHLKLQYEEVKDVMWASKDEIFSAIDDNTFIPYHKSLIELLFHMRNKRGTFMRDE